MPISSVNNSNTTAIAINASPSASQRIFTLTNTTGGTTATNGGLALSLQFPNSAAPTWDFVSDVSTGNLYLTASPNNGSGPSTATSWLSIKGSTGATTLSGPITFTNSLTATTGVFSSTLIATTLASTLAGFASSAVSGSNSATSGSFVSVKAQTFNDASTAASSSSAASFSGTFIGAPTLTATNTAVTTPIASTLLIAGPPIASTNQTITSPYALNILTGISQFGGPIRANSNLITPNIPWGNFGLQSQTASGTQFMILLSNTTGNMTLNAAGNAVNITVTGNYCISIGFESNPTITEFVIYINGNVNNRLLNRYNNGNAFPDSRHMYAVSPARLSAGDTVSAYLTTSASTSLTNVFSRGLSIALISQLA